MYRYKTIALFYVEEDGKQIPLYHPWEEVKDKIKDVCAKCGVDLPIKGRIRRYTERGNWCLKCDRQIVHKQQERLRLQRITITTKITKYD